MTNLKQTIMRRDRLSSKEADQQIEEAKEALRFYLEDNDFESAENICEEFFGLEPDYIVDLMDFLG